MTQTTGTNVLKDMLSRLVLCLNAGNKRHGRQEEGTPGAVWGRMGEEKRERRYPLEMLSTRF